MKISFKGDYALKIILDLSLAYNKGVLKTREMAERLDIPEKYLEQIITILKGAGYIKTTRGAKGGIELAKAPQHIVIGEIIRLTDGSTSPIGCVSRSCNTKCDYEKRCVFKSIWEEIRDRTNEIVDNISFQEMAEKSRKLGGSDVLDYVI